MCPYFSKSQDELLLHLVKCHRNTPSFIVHCCAKGCGASYKNYGSFRSHCYRKHYQTRICSSSSESFDDGISLFDYRSASVEDKQSQEAAYILKLRAGHRLTQGAVVDVIQSTKYLLNEKIETIKSAVQSEYGSVSNIESAFSDDLFNGLETHFKQNAYFKKYMGYIPPQTVKLGEKTVRSKLKGKLAYRKRDMIGYIVPFLEQLQSLLKMPEVCQYIFNENETKSHDLMNDIQDGNYSLQHTFIQGHDFCLKFVLYTDDFEIVNPIGSHRKKHKCSAFYWTLLNIPCELRSKLSAIQLYGIIKTSDMKKCGLNTFLSDFVESMKKLSNGVLFEIEGSEKRVYGMLMCVLADTPAANFLGGFKEGVGGAQRPCRTCDVHKADLDTGFVSTSFQIRNQQEHDDRLSILAEVSPEARKYWSSYYGINGVSVLQNVPHFSVTKCILHDPMHVLLEGVVRQELRLLLCALVDVKKYFTLSTLNMRISQFEYSDTARLDKPQPIERHHLQKDSTFAQTATSMLVLITHLPLLIGDLVEESDTHWINFLGLLQITMLSLSPVASSTTVNTLKHLIAQHNAMFKHIYPEVSFTPKRHYMVHLPDQLVQFGPLRTHWCMRFEAKNGFFKLKRWFNFKNLQKSLVEYHQLWMCMMMSGPSGKPSETYLYDGDSVQEGVSVPISSITNWQDILKLCDSESPNASELVLISSCVKIRGIQYKPGYTLLTALAEEPRFVEIHMIVVVEHAKIFLCKRKSIQTFSPHLNCFNLKDANEYVAINPLDMRYVWPQISYNINGQTWTMLKHVDDVWTL